MLINILVFSETSKRNGLPIKNYFNKVVSLTFERILIEIN